MLVKRVIHIFVKKFFQMITNLKLHLLCCNQLSDAVIILTLYKKERRELELVANDKSMTVI